MTTKQWLPTRADLDAATARTAAAIAEPRARVWLEPATCMTQPVTSA